MRKYKTLKQFIKKAINLLALILIFVSCSPEYIPNMVNSPMFSNQGEFQITIAAGKESPDAESEVSITNFDAQTALALTDHFGIMINGSYGKEKNDAPSSFHEHSFLEAGMGYYDKFRNKYRYEVFGGYGFGKTQGYFENGFVDEITNVRYNRYFIQPGIGISNKIFDGSFSPRIVLVQMERLVSSSETTYNTFYEPVITSKIGYKYVKFIVQFGFSIPIGDQELTYDHPNFIFNFGLNFNLGRKYYDF